MSKKLGPYQIVHIGLGKCATTTLQSSVFPKIPIVRPYVTFNPPSLMSDLSEIKELVKCEELENAFNAKVKKNNYFISKESLVGGNPRSWLTNANQNLRLFGSDAKIIITARKTEDYLRSLYQEMIHNGEIWQPNEFFVNKFDYDAVEKLTSSGILSRFDVDSFDLEYLYQIYIERFENVSIVPFQEIHRLDFLKKSFKLKDNELAFLRKQIREDKIYNRAYSKHTMRLTLLREKLLNTVGLATIRPREKKLQKIWVTQKIKDKKNFGRSNLQLIKVAYRLSHGLKNRLRWRYLMQNFLDKIIPYDAYSLPPEVYRNEALSRKNDEFIKKFTQEKK